MAASDPLALARTYIGKVVYCRYADIYEAPFVVNCITFVRWLYGRQSVRLSPDYLAWLELGIPVEQASLASYDLIFTDGYRSQTVKDVGRIGHVGIATGQGTVIHATSRVGIEEVPLDVFFTKRIFCCARRIIFSRKSR